MYTVKNKSGDTEKSRVEWGSTVEQRKQRGLKLKISVRTGLWTQRADI
jgi:hypothetical protein